MRSLDNILKFDSTVYNKVHLVFFKMIFFSIFFLAPAVAAQTIEQTYPKLAGYVGIVHPIVAISRPGITKNFNGTYTGGFVTGINIWKSAKIGFSLEVVPFIHVENRVSKMNNLLFHPGVLFPIGNGYTLVGRAAFETSGRYGFTPVLNKVIKRAANSNFFLALPAPVRFGNEKPTTLTLAFQFGMGF